MRSTSLFCVICVTFSLQTGTRLSSPAGFVSSETSPLARRHGHRVFGRRGSTIPRRSLTVYSKAPGFFVYVSLAPCHFDVLTPVARPTSSSGMALKSLSAPRLPRRRVATPTFTTSSEPPWRPLSTPPFRFVPHRFLCIA